SLSESLSSCDKDDVSCLRIGQSPASPSFPYTTLFRSPRAGRQSQDRHDRYRSVPALGSRDGGPIGARVRRVPSGPTYRRSRRSQDRKSTRLNSSHVKISYAVFCLKKKKIKYKNRVSC